MMVELNAKICAFTNNAKPFFFPTFINIILFYNNHQREISSTNVA
jgi:hypothetical protein